MDKTVTLGNIPDLKTMKKENKRKNILKICIFITIIGYISFQIIRWSIQDYYLVKYGKTTIGHIVKERGYNGVNGHFIDDEQAVHLYSFTIDNKIYNGDSQSSKYKIGDTIKVIYIEDYPFINRPYYYLKK